MRVVVNNHITLDGVMQAPGAPDEDTQGLGDSEGPVDLQPTDSTLTPTGVLSVTYRRVPRDPVD